MPRQAQKVRRDAGATRLKKVVSTKLRPLFSLNGSVTVVQETGYASGPVWAAQKISLPPGFDPPVVQL